MDDQHHSLDTSGSWLCISKLINSVSGAEITLPIFCIWGPSRSCLRVPWQDTAFKPKFTAPDSTAWCFHTCSWLLVCAWLRLWYKFLSFSLSLFYFFCFSSEITHSSDPLFMFLQHSAWQPVCLMAVIVSPSCSPVFSLAVNLSCPAVQTLPAGVLCPMPKAWHQFCPGFVALHWLNQLSLGLLVLEQGDGQQSLTEVTKE